LDKYLNTVVEVFVTTLFTIQCFWWNAIQYSFFGTQKMSQ